MDVEKYLLDFRDEPIPSAKEVLSENDYPIKWIREDSEWYYIEKPEGFYDESLWVINKKTGEVGLISDWDFYDYQDQTTIVNPPYDNLKIGP